MTPKKNTPTKEEKQTQLLEEICEHTMAIRRVTNRMLDHLHEQHEDDSGYHDPDELNWEDMNDYDDMFL